MVDIINRICMVLEWTLEEASLLQDRPFSASASVYISVYISRDSELLSGDDERYQTGKQRLCMRLVLVSFTLIYSCMCTNYYTFTAACALILSSLCRGVGGGGILCGYMCFVKPVVIKVLYCASIQKHNCHQ